MPIEEPLVKDMFFTIYQHSKHFNLETLLMFKIFNGIFDKIPPSWKLLSTIYQFSLWIDLIGNYHNSIFKLKNSGCKSRLVENFLVKKRGFCTSVCKYEKLQSLQTHTPKDR